MGLGLGPVFRTRLMFAGLPRPQPLDGLARLFPVLARMVQCPVMFVVWPQLLFSVMGRLLPERPALAYPVLLAWPPVRHAELRIVRDRMEFPAAQLSARTVKPVYLVLVFPGLLMCAACRHRMSVRIV